MVGNARDSEHVAPALWFSGASEAFGLDVGQACEFVAGTDLGGLTITRLLGAGGMGRVYEARQASPDRLVAVKVMSEVTVSPERRRRFEYEAELLARLRHPHIAQVFTCGTFPIGPTAVPFIVMELVVDARPITRHAVESGLDVAARVGLFRQACAAVAHGHQKGVIHRDLKPGNLLVDPAGDVKVIDFGVAKSLAADMAPLSFVTQSGQLVGTLAYMSPEQLAGRIDEIDARTDVYALGLVLHELVTNQPPQPYRGTAAVDIHTEPDHDAAATVERAARGCGCARAAARALGSIVATCLNRQPARRYATAIELAAELDRWAAGEPILAQPPTWTESLVRLARRHRATAVAAVTVLVSLVMAVASISFFFVRAERQAARARADLYVANLLLAVEARDENNLPESRRRLATARALVADSGSRRPVELDCIEASLDESLAVLAESPSTVLSAAWSPDGERVVFGARDGTVRIVAVPGAGADAASAVDLVGHTKEVWRTAWAPDGARVATASEDKTVRLWDAATGREVVRITGHAAKVYGAAFSRDGKVLATSGADGTVRLWDATTGEPVQVIKVPGGTVYDVALSRDGRTVMTGSQDGTVALWDSRTATVERRFSGHTGRVVNVAFSPDETRLASAAEDGTARVWRRTDGTTSATIEHGSRVNSVAFAASGRYVATASGDGMLRIFTAGRGREVHRARGHVGALMTVTASPNGAAWATGSMDGTLRLWAADGDAASTLRVPAPVRAVAYDSQGGVLAVGRGDATVSLHDARTLETVGRLTAARGAIRDVCFAGTSGTLAAACDDGTVRLWSTAGDADPRTIACHARRVYSVAFTADGTSMATASDDNTASIRPLAGTSEPRVLRHPKRCFCARFAPDDQRLFTACEDGRGRVWDVVSGRLVAELSGHDAAVNWLVVSPDGRHVATASSDRTVGVWNAANGRLLRRLEGPAKQVWKVAFSPDGSRLAATGVDGDLFVWEASTGRALPVLHGHAEEAWGLAFAPHGGRIATGALDGTVRIAGLSPGELFRARLAVTRSPR